MQERSLVEHRRSTVCRFLFLCILRDRISGSVDLQRNTILLQKLRVRTKEQEQNTLLGSATAVQKYYRTAVLNSPDKSNSVTESTFIELERQFGRVYERKRRQRELSQTSLATGGS